MLIATYGSLKKGFYNHGALGTDAKLMGKSRVFGVMYTNGSYPKLYHAELQNELARSHEVEVYDISDKAYEGIYAMEIGAGYELDEIETKWGIAGIYYMPQSRFDEEDEWIEEYTH